MTDIQKDLFAMQDIGYRDFQAKLMPTILKERVIGVRTPLLRAFAKKLSKEPAAQEFLKKLPHTYYEENNLHAFLVAEIRDFDAALRETERFLPYIDNWATCDSFLPKAFRKAPEKLLPYIKKWMASKEPYTVRYAIGLYLHLFLDEHFSPDHLAEVARVESEEYYVNMMIAWYFATALAKKEAETLPYLTEKRLSPWVHRKAIQKAVESYRIRAEMKEYLKTLKER